jgi:hypothetical protein
LKSNKAAGPDDTVPAFRKNGGFAPAKTENISNNSENMEARKMPSGGTEGTLCTGYKKGDRNQCNNYGGGGVSLLNIACT